jgi:hypothetical protein
MKTIGWAMALTLVVSTAGWCGEKGEKDNGSSRSSRGAHNLDISKLPIYPGAELVREVNLGADQIKEMVKNASDKVSPKTLQGLDQLGGVMVRGYKLPKDASAKAVLAHYESRILAAGFKQIVKNIEKDEAVGVYVSATMGVVVINVDNEDPEDGNQVEIVSVLGDMKALAKLGELEKLEKQKGDKKKGPKTEEPPIPDNDKAEAK